MSVSLIASAAWIERFLTGQAALALATIAVALLGLTVMAGQLPIRRGIEVTIGIFLIFGAPIVARGLTGTKLRQTDTHPATPSGMIVHTTPPSPSAYDPYAGASVPQNRTPSDTIVPVQ